MATATAEEVRTLSIAFTPTVSQFVLTSATGQAREIAAFGARGDGKTIGAMGTAIYHAKLHGAMGYRLPTSWWGFADTFSSHKAKTFDSLQDQMWGGCWRSKDIGHLWVFSIDGQDMVNFHLSGVEDQSALDRLRMQTHGLWFEEPAPSSVLVQSSGLSEAAWAMGITSQRLKTFCPVHLEANLVAGRELCREEGCEEECHPAIMTLNYPNRKHWTWQRFVERPQPGTAYFRIPPGERASKLQRAEWSRALQSRPDLLKRLIDGEPGLVALGPEVAVGYSSILHDAPAPMPIVKYAPVWMGHDGGHWPSTCLGQRIDGQCRVFASLCTPRGGTKQHLEQTVIPWLTIHMPWVLAKGGSEYLFHRIDPSMDTGDQGDIDSNPKRRLKASLGGQIEGGAVSWPGRRDPLLAVLDKTRRILQIDPTEDTELLREALAGSWYYKQEANGETEREKPHKPNPPWGDIGDAFCYLIGGMAPSLEKIVIEKEPVPEWQKKLLGQYGRRCRTGVGFMGR